MLNFLYTAVSWVLLRWHDLFDALGVGANWAWALSIVFLVITARLLLFRLFIKQVHYQRNMQKIQPKIQKLREKHKGDKAALNREMMALQQSEGFNPLAGCLPMFLQIPVFIGLYHVLRHLSNSNALCQKGDSKSHLLTLYTFSKSDTCGASEAKIFHAPLAASFRDGSDKIATLGGDLSSTRILLVILLIISASATFATQLLVRSNATTPPEGTAATVQKLMLYLIPVGTLASGLLFNFPLGVLLYWFTSNLWTLGQQGYIIRFHPPTDDREPATTGAVGKTLAPKPGQRPVRMSKNGGGPAAGAPVSGATEATSSGRNGSQHGSGANGAGTRNGAGAKNGTGTKNGAGAKGSVGATAAASDGGSANGAPRSEPARGAVPRPGQRPNRPSGKRPPAKRATQTKKRR